MSVAHEDIAKEVLRLQERDGVCIPSAFVDAARNATSPLHCLFEWDDAVEAEQWREHRARQIIGRVTVTINGTRTPAHVSVTVTAAGQKRQGYVPVDVAMQDADLRQQVFTQARAGLNGWRNRLAAFTEALEAVELLDQAIEHLFDKEEEQ